MLATLLVGLAVAQPVVAEADPDTPAWTASAEYLVWWIRRGYVPAVVTTSSPASQGLLDRPDTRVVYGDERLETRHDDRFVGTRLTLNWREPGGLFGLEGRAFFLERDSTYLTIKYQSDRLLAFSYVDAATGRQASEVFAGPDPRRGDLQGGFVGYSRIEWFGEEANATFSLAEEEDWKLDLLAGGRFLQMRDRYHQTATSLVLPEQSHLYGVIDNVRVANAFYGGQLGLRGEACWGRLFVQGRATAALGADDQLVRAWGQRIDHTPERRIVTNSGLFVQQSNTGHFDRCHLDAAGEVGANVGYELTSWLRATAGYTFLYWADPLRAGKQLDRVIDTSQPAARPAIPFRGDALWAQGVSVGLEARW
jgi:hypothetical protein